MAYTVTLDDQLVQKITDHFTTKATGPRKTRRSQREASDLLAAIAALPRQQVPEQLPVDGDPDDDSLPLTVVEEVVTELHIHPERFPGDYSFDDDPDQLLANAVADATSFGMGNPFVPERRFEGLD